VGGDVPVDSETPMVTPSISGSNPPARSSECAHKGRVCMCVQRGEYMRVYVNVCVCTVFKKKKTKRSRPERLT
jgi:hypothetical protein